MTIFDRWHNIYKCRRCDIDHEVMPLRYPVLHATVAAHIVRVKIMYIIC